VTILCWLGGTGCEFEEEVVEGEIKGVGTNAAGTEAEGKTVNCLET
jgi:hypothetical protein